MRRVLLLFTAFVALQFTASAQFNFNNDVCNNSNILCAGGISPNKGLTTQNKNADAPPGACISAGGRGVWFFVEGQITGGSVSVNISNIDSVNCGMEMQIFTDAGGCALAPLGACVAGVDFASASGGPGNSTMSCTFTVTAGVRYQILVSTPPGCTNGEQFFITANTNGVGIDASNDSSIMGFPVAELTSIILDPCDTSQIRLINNSRDKGGTVSYFLDTLGVDDYFDWMIPVGGSDTIYYTPCNSFQPRLVACNECVEDCDVNNATDLPGDFVSVPSAALSPEVDTVFPGCVGSPIGFEVAATMMGDVLGNPQPDLDRFILEVVQRCNGNLDTTIFYIGQVTAPPGKTLPDTIVNSGTGHYREIIADTIINPDLEFIDGRDTIYDYTNALGDIGYQYIPCGDTLWVKIKAEGFCNKPGGCPDSVEVVFELEPEMLPIMDDTVQFCVDDLGKNIPFELDLVTGGGIPPFTITWYDSVMNPAFEITTAAGISASGMDTLDHNEMSELRDLFAFHPKAYENDPHHRFIIKVEDDFGCIVFDTVEVKLCKPVIDSLHITNFDSATAACDNDHDMVPEAPSVCPGTLLLPSNPGYPIAPDPLNAFEFCPGDSIPLSLTIRGKPGLKIEWFDADPASGAIMGPASGVFSTLPPLLPAGDSLLGPRDSFHIPNSPTNDSIFYFKDRSKTADFTLAVVLTDSAGCTDTAYVCIPIHEPPTIMVVDTLCGDDPPPVDSMFHVMGSCDPSTYQWFAVDPNAPPPGYFADPLLMVNPLDDSYAWFNYQDASIPPTSLGDTVFMFAVIVDDGITGCRDTVDFTFQVDTPFDLSIVINPDNDTVLCFGESALLEVDLTTGLNPAGLTFEWYQLVDDSERLMRPAELIPGETGLTYNASPLDTTKYIIHGMRSGCEDWDTITLIVDTLPIAIAAMPDTVCEMDTVLLLGDGSSDIQHIFSWTNIEPGNTIEFDTAKNTRGFMDVVIASDTFTLLVTDTVTGCTKDTFVPIMVLPFPVAIMTVNGGVDSVCTEPSDTNRFILDGRASTVAGSIAYAWEVMNMDSPQAFISDSTADSTGLTVVIPQNMLDTFIVVCLTVTDTTLGNIAGCDSMICDTIFIGMPAQIQSMTVSPNDTVCNCDTVRISVGINDTLNRMITWTSDSGNTLINADSLTVTVQACNTDTLRLTILDTLTMCQRDTFVPIWVNPVPTPIIDSIVADISGNDTLCPSVGIDTVRLYGRGIGTNLAYLWQANPPATIGDPTAAITYALTNRLTEFSLTVTDTFVNCDSTTVDTLFVYPVPVATPDSNSFCSADTFKVDTIRISGLNGATSDTIGINGLFPDNDQAVSSLTKVNDSIWYVNVTTHPFPDTLTFGWQTVNAITGCTDTIQTSIILLDTIALAASAMPDTICENSIATLIGTGAVNYTWSSVPNDPSLAGQQNNDTVMISPPPIGGNDTTYIYKVVGNIGGCVDSVIGIAVHVNPLPIVNAGPDVTFCIFDTTGLGGDVANPTAPAGATIIWSPNYNIDDTTIANPRAWPDTTTAYALMVIDSNGCVNVDTVVITVNPLPIVLAGADTAICNEDSRVLGDTLTCPTCLGGSTYAWSPNFMLNDSTLAKPTATPDTTTTYIVTVTDHNGCIDMDTATVTVNPLPNVTAHTQPLDTACSAGPLGILVLDDSITSVAPPVTVLWTPAANLDDPNIEDPTFTSPAAGSYTYVITVTDTNMCVETDTVTVEVVDSPTIATLAVAPGDSLCEGETVTATAIFANIDNVLWEAIPNVGSFNIIRVDSVEFTAPGYSGVVRLRVTATNNGCGSVMDSINVFWFPAPIADANANTTVDTICEGTSVSLMGDSTNALSISWQEAPATPVGGTFTSTTTDTTTWTPPVGFGGNVRFYFNVVGIGTCLPTLDSVDVFVQLNPTADVGAGPYADICKQGTVNIFANGQNGTVTWTDGGIGGTFVPATGNTPVYTAPAGYSGAITITSNVISPFAACGAASDNFSITVFDSTTVRINLPTADTTICETGVVAIVATATNQSGVSWTGSPTFTPPNSLTPTWNPPIGSGTYTLTVTANNLNPCPAAQDSFDVTVIAIPIAGTGGPYNDLCVNSCMTLNGTGANGVISWSDGGVGGTFNPPNSNNSQYCPPISYSGPITLTQFVTSTFGPCGIDSSSFTIEVFDSTTTAISNNDTIICDGSTIQLVSASTNQSTVTWTSSLGAIFSNPNGAQTDFTPTAGPGTYLVTLTATNATPCPNAVKQISVTVVENPQVSPKVSGLTACQGDTIQLIASPNSGVDGTITWDDGGSGGTFVPDAISDTVTYVPNFDPNTTTTVDFTVTATSLRCGDATGTISVTFNELPVILFADTVDNLCGSEQVCITGTGGVEYAFGSFNASGTGDTTNYSATTTQCYRPTETTTFTIFGRNAEGCEAFAVQTVGIRPNPIPTAHAEWKEGDCYPTPVDFSYDYLDFGRTPTEVGVTHDRVFWNYSDGNDTTFFSDQPTHQYTYGEAPDSTYPVNYQVVLEVEYDNGCTATDTVYVEVCEGTDFPNVFTPNGDGVNDFFKIRGMDTRDCDLVVFDRWGDKRYEQENYNGQWSGQDMNGDELNADVYYYVLKCADGATYTGWVKIIRPKK